MTTSSPGVKTPEHMFLIRTTLVVACCAKIVSINVIPRKCPGPIGKAIGYLSQLDTYRHVFLALQVQTR
jgi:hypothetical protein